MDDKECQEHVLQFKQHPNCKMLVFQAFLFRQTFLDNLYTPRNSNPLTANSVNISCDIELSREGWVEQQEKTNKWAKQIILGNFS